jgi:hypothetical protein
MSRSSAKNQAGIVPGPILPRRAAYIRRAAIKIYIVTAAKLRREFLADSDTDYSEHLFVDMSEFDHASDYGSGHIE